MDFGQIMSIVVSVVGLVGFYFAGKKVWWSWYINLFCQLLWVTFALVTGYLMFLATAAVYSVIFGINAYRWTKDHFMVKRMLAEEKSEEGWKRARGLHLEMAEEPESNLVKHARTELELIGEEPETIEWYVRVIKEFAAFGHSGSSAWFTTHTLSRLLQFEPLAHITNRSEDWFFHDADVWGEEGGVWQNKRDSRLFSTDGGKTYYNVNDNSKRIETSVDWEE